MTTTTAYTPARIEDVLSRPCGCGALAWTTTAFGRIGCAECGAWLSRPCGLPAPAPVAA